MLDSPWLVSPAITRLHGDLIVRTHLVRFRSARRAPQTAAAAFASGFFFLVFPVDIIVLPYLMRVCSTFFQFQPPGELEEEMENPEMVNLPEKQKHQLRHRELFLSRQLESLPATHIRYAYILCLRVLFLLYLHFKVLAASPKVTTALVLDLLLLIGKQFPPVISWHFSTNLCCLSIEDSNFIDGSVGSRLIDFGIFLQGEVLCDAAERDGSPEVLPGQRSTWNDTALRDLVCFQDNLRRGVYVRVLQIKRYLFPDE